MQSVRNLPLEKSEETNSERNECCGPRGRIPIPGGRIPGGRIPRGRIAVSLATQVHPHEVREVVSPEAGGDAGLAPVVVVHECLVGGAEIEEFLTIFDNIVEIDEGDVGGVSILVSRTDTVGAYCRRCVSGPFGMVGGRLAAAKAGHFGGEVRATYCMKTNDDLVLWTENIFDCESKI